MSEKEKICYGCGMLSDIDIKRYFNDGIKIFTHESGKFSFDLEKQLQLGSVDLRFRREYKKFHLEKGDTITYSMLEDHSNTKPFDLKGNEKLRIEPGEVIITTSLEIVEISKEFAAIITGRSSIARLGIMVHCCQEFINPGHRQSIPLQIINLSSYTVELDLDVPICQIVFFKLATPASGEYSLRLDSKYNKETDPLDSKIYVEISHDEVKEEKRKNIDNSKKSFENTTSNKSIKFKKILKKFFLPFLPSLIIILIITPFINTYIMNKSVLEIFNDISSVAFNLVIGVLLLVLYFWLKRGD